MNNFINLISYKEGIDPPHVKIAGQGPLPDILRKFADIAEELQTRFDPMWRDPGMEAVAKENGFELSGPPGSRLDSDAMKQMSKKDDDEKEDRSSSSDDDMAVDKVESVQHAVDTPNAQINSSQISSRGNYRGRGRGNFNNRGNNIRGQRGRGRGNFRGHSGYQSPYHAPANVHQTYHQPSQYSYQQSMPPSPYGGPLRQTYQQGQYTAPY